MEKAGITFPEKVNVLIQKGECAISLLPEFGGKVSSIRLKGRELLQVPLAEIQARTADLAFDAGDASGWDECLPSVAACTVNTANGPVNVPDHGDVWRVAWTADNADAARVTLRAECFSLPLALERTAALSEIGGGWRLQMDYRLTNTGEFPVPWSWSAHPLFAAEEGDLIELPESISALRLEGSGDGRLGATGDTVAWPVASLAAGGNTDLHIAQSPASRIGDKLFAGPLQASESWCALRRPRAGVRIRMSYDTATVPYLGLWLCYGGWPDGPGPKQMCVALEPCTAPVDSLAQSGPWSRVLAPKESSQWAIVVDFEVI